MGLINETIPNLINGVSQQPSSVRRKTQCESQINGLSSVVDGLQKRPPTEYKANLGTLGDSFIHNIRRDENEWYSLIVTPSDTSTPLRVFDKDGAAQNVVISTTDKSYLTSIPDPLSDISATTVADYTFIANKTKVVAESSTFVTTRNPEALIYIRQGDYSTDYSVTIQNTNGTVAASTNYTTPDSSTVNHEPHVKTNQIASQIYNGLSLPSHFSKGIKNNVIHIVRNDGNDFKIGASDSRGSRYMFAFKDQTEDFKDLPANDAPVGFYIKVGGQNEKLADDYWLKTVDAGGTGQSVWEESAEGGISDGFDATTMPHQLIRMPDGYFCFSKANGDYYDYNAHTLSSSKPSHANFVKIGDWTKRSVGDDDSNSMPSFVGFKINDCFFYKNRLGFLSDENVILSESSEYFGFFRTTVMSLLDGDPVDIAVSNNKVSILRHAIPFSEQLIMFSDLTQFSLKSDGNLTAKTVSIDTVTQYEASLDAKPVPAGKYIFFGTQRGKWSGVREYFVDSSNDTQDAEEITAHVPSYLEGKITKLAASSNLSMLVALCADDPTSMYVYSYYVSGSDKLQSAWSKWTFTGNVKSVEFSGANIWLIIERSGSLYLEKINLSTDLSESDTVYTANGVSYKFGIKLDRRVKLITGGLTAVPYADSSLLYVTKKGKEIPLSGVASELAGGGLVYAGTPYDFSYQFTEPNIKQDNQAVSGRLQVRSFKLLYSDSGYFKTTVVPLNRTSSIKVFSGRIIGKVAALLGYAPVDSGVFTFPVLSNAENVKISIESSSYLPCSFQSAGWEGYFKSRSQRI